MPEETVKSGAGSGGGPSSIVLTLGLTLFSDIIGPEFHELLRLAPETGFEEARNKLNRESCKRFANELHRSGEFAARDNCSAGAANPSKEL